MSVIQINGFDLHFDDRGQGEPLLLLHGGMGIASDWKYAFPSDPDGFRVIAPDLRGHGRSTNPGGEFTFRQCARDVLALLDHLGLARVNAIGMSLGAKTLLHVATIRPDAVAAMVLVSATPRFEEPLRKAAAAFTRDSFEGLPEKEKDALRARHVHGDAQILALYDMTRSFATSRDDMAFTQADLAAISARTLIVHGDRDPLYPVELAVELHRGIPGSALWVVPNAGHGPIFGPLAAPFAAAALAHLRARNR
jgi:pimeloyl-ACP methyl ester carboxylesterase